VKNIHDNVLGVVAFSRTLLEINFSDNAEQKIFLSNVVLEIPEFESHMRQKGKRRLHWSETNHDDKVTSPL